MKIVIVDYGLGNIFAIQRAVQQAGGSALITAEYKDILEADRVILPGVGAFGDAIQRLQKMGLDKVLTECCLSGKFILGICLGMQLLMTTSEEFGFHHGLDFISGKIVRFSDFSPEGIKYKIPHVGWNRIFTSDGKSDSCQWKETILSANFTGDFVYFAHSYIAIPDNPEHILAVTEYNGIKFCSAVQKGNIFGCQFHPELSGESGLKIYRKFVQEGGMS